MANKYYWLKLKEDFFQQEAIEWLEEQKNGKEYSLFYLKLCLKSLQNAGTLVRQIGTKTIPYTVKKLAEVTNTTLVIAKEALEALMDIGLVIERNDGALFIPGLAEMVGSEASNANALRQKRYRDRHKSYEGVTNSNAQRNASNNNSNTSSVTNSNVDIRDKRLEIRNYDDDNNSISPIPSQEKRNTKAIQSTTTSTLAEEVDSKAITDNVFLVWQDNISPLTPIIGEKIKALIDECGEDAVLHGISAACEQNVRTIPYVASCARNYLSGRSYTGGKQCKNDVAGTAQKVLEAIERGEGNAIWG
ncbi:MAG: phage replisome organizer N-terminal domain-containing protein [Phascolarctobacterium sp.]